MAVTVFWLYPNTDEDGGPNGWMVDPTAALVADPYNAPDDSTRGESDPIARADHVALRAGMTAPAAAVVIDSVTLYARVWAVSQNSTPHDLTDVKGFYTDPTGRGTTLPGRRCSAPLAPRGQTRKRFVLGVMTSRTPATEARMDDSPSCRRLAFGLTYTDQDFGSKHAANWKIGSVLHPEVEAQTIAQSIEGRRAEGTALPAERLGRLHLMFEVLGAAGHRSDLEPGERGRAYPTV